MENTGPKTEPRGLAYSAGYSAGQKLSQAGNAAKQRVADMGQRISRAPERIRENRASIQKNVGAQARRGGLSVNGSQGTPQNWGEVKDAAANMAVKGGPILFWLVAGIAIIKDIIDVFTALLDALGIALTATAVGAPVGIPLGIFAEILDKIAGMMIDFTLVAYFGYIGGGFALRLIIMSVGAMIDMIPFLDILPLTTVTFFAAYLFGRAAKAVTSSLVAEVAGGAINTGKKAAAGAKRVGGLVARFAK